MHAPEPWTCVRSETSEYYVYEIHADGGHVASVAGWANFGTICPITVANARLLTNAPALLDALKGLVEWGQQTGGWDAPCWRQAEELITVIEAAPPLDEV